MEIGCHGAFPSISKLGFVAVGTPCFLPYTGGNTSQLGKAAVVATIIWLGIAVTFGVVEAAAPALVCIWFCVGAVAAFLVSLFSVSILVQTVVFLVVSCAALLALRPFFRKSIKVKPDEALTDVDAYVGREVTVTQDIPAGNDQCGRVKMGDVSWLARTVDGGAVPAGARVVVEAVDSTVLVVRPA